MFRSSNRVAGLVLGALYLALGILGFALFGARPGALTGVALGVSPAHGILQLLIGSALLLAVITRLSASKRVNIVLGTLFLVLGLAGLFVIGTPFDILGLTATDNVLHFASAVALLAVGLGGDRDARPAPAA